MSAIDSSNSASSSKSSFHLLTSNEIVARSNFLEASLSVIEALKPNCYFHLRVNTLSGTEHLKLATQLQNAVSKVGAHLVLNGRVDIALACGVYGVQLGRGSLPWETVQAIWKDRLKIGVSVHGVEDLEALRMGAQAGNTLETTLVKEMDSEDPHLKQEKRASRQQNSFPSWIIAGHVFETSSHPDSTPLGMIGLGHIIEASKKEAAQGGAVPEERAPGEEARAERTIADRPDMSVIAVGGINLSNTPKVLAAGANGIAVISDVWGADDPKARVTRYLSIL